MTPERWRQIKEIFDQAVEYEAGRRGGFLTAACGGDVNLRIEVEALLEGHAQASGFIEEPAAALAAHILDAEPNDTLVGQHIGPYKVLKEIGHGGMGQVYLAVRADDYMKRVALKVVKRGMDTQEIVRRFHHERQILAWLDHPNIAKLLDGGTTEDGLPYFVMEYVEGRQIIDYCDSRKLLITERLKLFRQVCAAVQFAHQNLVVHRDIKPSNILATEDGTPKLLDFGIAKLLNPDLSPMTIAPTQTAMRLMTPEYASPEQVRGENITTASDVYSLGVVLYELLTGHRPYHVKGRTPHEIIRAVCEEEPEKPSTAVNRIEERTSRDGAKPITLTPQVVSATREGDPEKLRRCLRGDLDNIVLMAMRKEPHRRYTTVNQLSEDIRRHLEGMPVVAGRDTFTYRVAKFVHRNKAGTIAAVAVFLTLLVGIVATSWQARVASRERERAERRFNDVRQLANDLMFELHDDIAKLAGSTQVREKLVKRALRYLDSLADEGGDPMLQLELAAAYRKVGLVQGNPNGSNLGDTAGAVESYRKAVSICENLAHDHKNKPEVQRDLADSYQSYADMLAMTGKLTEAVQHYRRSNEIYQSLFATDSQDAAVGVQLARGYLKLGDTLGSPIFPNLGDKDGALDNFRKSLEVAGSLLTAVPSSTGARKFLYLGHERVGDIQWHRGDFAAALAGYQQSASITRTLLTTDPDNFVYRRHLAVLAQKSSAILLDHMRNVAAAQQEADKSMKIARELSEADPKDVELRGVLAYSYERQAAIQAFKNDIAGAIENYGREQEIYEALREADPLNVKWQSAYLEASQALADQLVKAGRKDEASRVKTKMMPVRRILTDSPGATAGALNAYAWELLMSDVAALRNPAAALPYAERAVEMSKRRDAAILDTLAYAYHLNGDYQRAMTTEQEALALLKEDSGLRKELEDHLAKFKAAVSGKSK